MNTSTPSSSSVPIENRVTERSDSSASKIENSSALYRTVWRWHFYAGILAAPFAIFLAITGAIYLWKPQYEAWKYAHLFNGPAASAPPAASVDAQFAAAQTRHPDAKAITFTPAFAPGRSSETVLRLPDGEKLTIFVDPVEAHVLGELRESDRLMATIHDLHGSLLAGKPGALLIELAASWLFVLVLTGFYLWWPRPHFTVWGFLLPRLHAKGRTFWRDVHAVPAVWFSCGALFLLSTGIPWTGTAGAWFKKLSAAAGQGTPRESSASAHRSELTGWSPPLQSGLAQQIDALASTEPDEHTEHRHHVPAGPPIENRQSKIKNAARPARPRHGDRRRKPRAHALRHCTAHQPDRRAQCDV